MTKKNFTATPNIIFDKLLKELSGSELKILLVIIRQTEGWKDKKTGLRKKRDQISCNQFISRTGISRRIISASIKILSQKRLIKITDGLGNELNDANKRQGRYFIYYSSSLDHFQTKVISDHTCAKNDTNMCKNRHQRVQKVIHNKRNSNKRNLSKESKPDYIHIGEAIEKIKLRWNPK